MRCVYFVERSGDINAIMCASHRVASHALFPSEWRFLFIEHAQTALGRQRAATGSHQHPLSFSLSRLAGIGSVARLQLLFASDVAAVERDSATLNVARVCNARLF